jgi:5'-nucleotidase
MRILVTNDDGIDAPGLHALRQIAAELAGRGGEVWVVAPETNQSGIGHALSLHEPLRMRALDERSFAVRGTPTDCVIMGVRHVLKGSPVDLVLSGVNRGQNVAEDITHSGTIAGAFEGTLMGIRSIALSQAFGPDTRQSPRWETAIALGPGVVRQLLTVDWPADVLMNVNFPDRAPGDVAGIETTRQGRRDLDLLNIDERHDTWGNAYYWIGFERRRRVPPGDGTDLSALAAGRISVTPLLLNLTAEDLRARLRLTV